MDLPPDFRDLLEELARDAVEFLLVGGYAVAFHGRPRATKDIDILLGGEPANLERAARAIARFGAPPLVVRSIIAMQESEIVFLGQPPLRVDFLRAIDGVSSEALFAQAVATEVEGIRLKVLSLDHLIANKRAAGRPQDLIDAAFLERVRARRSSGA
ncbi:MAG: nucleotidyltransferase [Labilithrix sp.]|nr:nucleotidyltransferase [Labilithrix sp.]MBX3225010.1 nucleotidyltransferase [Labilithrix sp.]